MRAVRSDEGCAPQIRATASVLPKHARKKKTDPKKKGGSVEQRQINKQQKEKGNNYKL